MAEAMSGFAAINGEPDGPPLLPPIALTDEVAALAGAFAVMVALRHRDRTGEGQVIDVNLLESMLQMMSALPSASAHLGYEQPGSGSGIPYTVPRGTYRCSDGVWIAISTSAESVAHRVLELLGVGDDARFASFEGRAEHREELDAIVSRVDRRAPVGRRVRRVRSRGGRDRARVPHGRSAGRSARARPRRHHRGRRRPDAGRDRAVCRARPRCVRHAGRPLGRRHRRGARGAGRPRSGGGPDERQR